MNQSKIDIREEWEEELKGMIFDRKDFDIDYDKLKSFISSSLHQREMEIVEELTGEHNHYGHTGECTPLCMQIKKDIINQINKEL